MSDDTKNIVVEIAHFDPVAVRKTGTRLGLRTDAELRFEKHINPIFSLFSFIFFLEESKYYASDLGKNDVNGISYHIGKNLKSLLTTKKEITINPEKGAKILFGGNTELFNETAERVLTNLGFTYKDAKVTIPFRRSPDDMNISEDIYEEVARIYGYDNINAEPMKGNT